MQTRIATVYSSTV